MTVETKNLGEYAKELARKTTVRGTVNGRSVCRETAADMKSVRRAAERCTGATEGEMWLYDNAYIAEREGQNVIIEMRAVKRLPKDAATHRAAVVQAADALVRSGGGQIDETRLGVFLNGYQQGRVMTECELTSFVAAVKSRLIALLGEVKSGDAEVEGNIFTSLRFLNGYQSSELIESVSRVETVLRTDPAGIYSRMDETTRARYRRRVTELARENKITELDAANRALRLARESNRHVGEYLFTEPLGKKRHRRSAGLYIASIIIVSLALAVWMSLALESIVIGFLILLPIWDAVKNVFDFAAVKVVPPDWIPRLELKNGIPPEGAALCVISILLTGKESAAQAVRRLEEYSITNRDAGRNLRFGLLADLKESDAETADGDTELIKSAAEGIERLNERYGARFYLLTRKRVWSAGSHRYMGWERKRGAICELARLVCGKPSGIEVAAGDADAVKLTKYIITLDSDTRLTAGSAVQLVGAAMHPLNTPVVSDRRVVTRGYGILAPRVSVELESAGQSDFTRILTGQGGIDPYGGIVSDVYQDVFGRGSFMGKGIIDAEVYCECLDGRFPLDTVLSHDLLEGAFIGCGFMSDIELADSTPGKVTSYYERSHRWIRGDWQNIGYLFGTIRTEDGGREKNPLGELDRWKIFENLRRSASPVFTLLTVLVGAVVPSLRPAAITAAILAVSGEIIRIADLAVRGRAARSRRYLSNIVTGAAGAIMQTVIKVMLIAYEAWVSFTAIVTALARLTVTKRNLLEWRTAAEAEGHREGTVYETYRRMKGSVLIGAAAILSGEPIGIALGVLWVLVPLYAWGLSKGIGGRKHISEADRRLLLGEAGRMWRYFEDNITPADSFLPPDNVQEQPAVGTAHRTSPTNIGLALMSALSAVDMKLVKPDAALGMIENIITSVERLPKWNGHLYNWYDTRTMKPLSPEYVSTVDSGNLAGCLIALKEGLRELGRDDLAARTEKLYRDMSFKPLYDRRRRLFHIGWDCGANEPTGSYYDLMASEARQTSYIAIARGDVPKKHWQALSRATVSRGGYSGLVSWTGTMFEYLMPNLLLPSCGGSLLDESAKFCVYVQKHDKRAPLWGVSESAYSEVDGSLTYRYRAHGMSALALKGGSEGEKIISPYSTFLALTVDRDAAIKNLKGLLSSGASGRYGLYEAIDYTESAKGRAVRTFMVHHLGMSILAVHSVLTGGRNISRFMSDTVMDAYRELLQEKIPSDSVELRRIRRVDIPEKPPRAAGDTAVRRSEGNSRSPACHTMSNGSYSVFVNELGHSRSMWGEVEICRFLPEQDGEQRGFDLVINTDDGAVPLSYRAEGITYGAEFTPFCAKITARTEKLTASVTVNVCEDERGEVRTVSVSSAHGGGVRGTVRLSFVPVMARARDYEAHPQFWRLSLEASYADSTLIIKRRGRGGDPDAYLAVSCDREVSFTTEGDAFKRYSTDMTAAVTAGFDIRGEGTATVKFAAAVGQNAEEARTAAERILKSSAPRIPRAERLMNELGITAAESGEAMEKLTELMYITPERRGRVGALEVEREKLWALGVSGDMPIMAAQVSDTDRAVKLVREHEYLTACGFRYDLVLLCDGGGDYRMPIGRAAGDWLRRHGAEHRLGRDVKTVDNSEANADVLRAAADCWEGEE